MRKSARATVKRNDRKSREKASKGSNGKASGGRRTDWARVDAKTDEDIARDITKDPDAAPEFTDEMFAAARWVTPAKRTQIALKVDPEVLAFFKAPGPGYQTRMNDVLRAYMEKAKPRRKPRRAFR
jgi:uncharacterized protein (DUF4415 family)